MGCGNAFALPPPLSYQGPLSHGPSNCQPPPPPPVCHVAPLTGVRVDRVDCMATCHMSAPCAPPAPHASHTWLCHVASVPHRTHVVVPRATSARPQLPLATSAPVGKKPLFAILNKDIYSIKIQIKIQKFLKCSEIHISQNTTPFNLKFSPLDHKFLSF